MTAERGKLTALTVKAAKPGKYFDGGGLYLDVRPNGSRYWRMKYRFANKERLLAFGVYPEVSLTSARAARDDARTLLRAGRDPAVEKQTIKRQAKKSAVNTFGAIADEWLNRQRTTLAEVTAIKAAWLLSLAAPLNHRPIADLGAPDVLAVLRVIENTGHHETVHRVKQRIGQVFRYAIATGRAERDPVPDLRGALTSVVSTPRAAVTDPSAIASLLRAIDSYTGQPTTHAALRLAPLVFARPGNLRAMEWTELDLSASEWRIPTGKMKMREAHLVPLSSQAVTILRELQPLTGSGRYVFPSLRTPQRPMSENTVNAALRRLGYDKDTMTGHGFRALASTRLNEMGWSPDVIERQLAHAERNKVRAVYNRAQYMAERRKMMQAWADYLDGLKRGGKIIPIREHAV
ncbi:MAG: integrase arm-type DNA-binding domain-containing protein [Rhodanobacteraceae bacterium]